MLTFLATGLSVENGIFAITNALSTANSSEKNELNSFSDLFSLEEKF